MRISELIFDLKVQKNKLECRIGWGAGIGRFSTRSRFLPGVLAYRPDSLGRRVRQLRSGRSPGLEMMILPASERDHIRLQDPPVYFSNLQELSRYAIRIPTAGSKPIELCI